MNTKDAKAGIQAVEDVQAVPLEFVKPLHAEDGDPENCANAPAQDVSHADNKRLFWMINRRVLPVMLVTYFCQSLDKGTLNFASIMGIRQDASLVGQQV